MEASVNVNKHAGWSEQETSLLWETADEAQQQGLPLKQVFERIASQTGRRPNSIRNYYYAQVRQREGMERTARFVPFTEDEVDSLVEKVLRARARGQSVRACLQELSGGDHSLMLRYQNKYRSVLRSRPELIDETIERLRGEGLEVAPVSIRPRRAANVDSACEQLALSARQASDPEIIRACETLSRLILSGGGDRTAQLDRMNVRLDLYRLTLTEQAEAIDEMNRAAGLISAAVKDFLVKPEEERAPAVGSFCETLTTHLGVLEAAATRAASVTR